MEEDNLDIEEAFEELAKGPNYWRDKDPAKYRKMLNKLKSARKTPGHKERAYQQVLQAKRREKGAPGTKAGHNGSGHSKGHMKTKTGSAAKRYQSSEKKAGTKLSIDRKDNSKGYEAGNTRNIPQKLNRGRHNADEKKVRNWKKRLKKADIDINDFVTLLQATMLEKGHEELYDLVRIMDMERFIDVHEDSSTDDSCVQSS